MSTLGPSGADSQGGGFVYVLGPCGSLQGTLLGGWEFLLLPHRFLQPEVLRLYFPGLEPWVVWSVSQSFLVYLHANVGPPSVPDATPSQIVPPWLPVSTPPSNLDESSLVIGLPYSSIFWQFWFFGFLKKFVVPFLLVV